MTNHELHPYSEQRPWGGFTRFTLNEVSTVKILRVHAGQSLSLQYHNNRTEHWYVIEGSGSAVIGEETVDLVAGQLYVVPVHTNHRITGGTDMQILEISLGEFDESDIVRLQDRYGRAADPSMSV